MILYKCDRCGREYNKTAMGCMYAGKETNFTECRIFYEIVCKSMYHPERSIDLCGDCTNELTLWIDCNPSGADDITPPHENAI